MFQLYKKRDFSALVGDTFGFFKLEGKNYFKNYFTINGGLLLLLVVIIYFFSNIFIKSSFDIIFIFYLLSIKSIFAKKIPDAVFRYQSDSHYFYGKLLCRDFLFGKTFCLL